MVDAVDFLFYRGIERWMIVIGGLIFGYMGCRLFLYGVDQGQGKLETENPVFKITFSGSGPGLFFMAFGALILMTSVYSTGDWSSRTTTTATNSNGAPSQNAPAATVTREATLKFGGTLGGAACNHIRLIDEDLEPNEQIFSAAELDAVYDEAGENDFDLSAPNNVFQNSETGAMVFIPAAIARADIAIDGDMLIAGRGSVQMYLLLTQTDSFDTAIAAAESFLERIDDRLGCVNWRVDDKRSDHEPRQDDDPGYWERSIYKVSDSTDGEEAISDLDTYLEIEYDDDYGEFPGVAVLGRDFGGFSEAEEEMLFLVANCARVSGFVLD